VIDNQLTRRNLDPFEARVLRGKKYLLEKKEAGRPQKKLGKNCAKMAQFSEGTREKIAQETGVSPRTIVRDAGLAQAVEDLKEIPKEILKQNPKKDIIELHKRPEPEKKRVTKIVKEKKLP